MLSQFLKMGLKLQFATTVLFHYCMFFNKILEKLMYKRLIAFIEKHRILNERQFGFRTRHSTEHAIMCIVDKIQRAIENRNMACGIFLDFSKAFDTIDHHILINKLDYYGVRGVAKSWFVSYLTNRKQVVSVNGVTSGEQVVSCGVPQGSVLGPLLFLIYINDFHNSSDLFEFHLFADDANLFCGNKDFHNFSANLNIELQKVNNWLCANKVSLNIEKSKYVWFHSPQKRVSLDKVKLMINERILTNDKHIKYLGVFLDSHLIWKEHININYISKKIRSNIGVLSKIRYFVTEKVLTNFYYALVYPLLTYAVIVWGNTYKTTIQPLCYYKKEQFAL